MRREISRRESLTWVLWYIATVLGINEVRIYVQHKKNSKVNPSPVLEEDSKAETDLIPLEIPTKIEGIDTILYGVEHTREFAQKNFSRLENLIVNSSFVVLEWGKGSFTNTVKSYINTVFELCKKNNKSIITLDPLNTLASVIESGVGLTSSSVIVYTATRMSNKQSRRKFLRKFGLITLMSYGLVSSEFEQIHLLKEQFTSSSKEKIYDKAFRAGKYYINHEIDQRNVEITNRLLSLSKLLKNELRQDSRYILVNFGRAHIVGIDYYLKHPSVRAIKSSIYNLSYNLIDADEIKLHRFRNGKWEQLIVKESNTHFLFSNKFI